MSTLEGYHDECGGYQEYVEGTISTSGDAQCIRGISLCMWENNLILILSISIHIKVSPYFLIVQ